MNKDYPMLIKSVAGIEDESALMREDFP